jgi:nucleoid DNA-binding protein
VVSGIPQSQDTDTDKKTAAFFLDVITDIALREVKKNGEFTFPNIGKLVKQKRKARIGRNPKTGEKRFITEVGAREGGFW